MELQNGTNTAAGMNNSLMLMPALSITTMKAVMIKMETPGDGITMDHGMNTGTSMTKEPMDMNMDMTTPPETHGYMNGKMNGTITGTMMP
jgi:hypothetical protein